MLIYIELLFYKIKYNYSVYAGTKVVFLDIQEKSSRYNWKVMITG